MGIQNDNKLVAIVDEEASMRSTLRDVLNAMGLPAQTFASAEEFLQSGLQHQPACLIVNTRLPGVSAMELQAKLSREQFVVPAIFIAADRDARLQMQVLAASAVEFLTSPVNDEDQLDVFERLWGVEPE